MRPENDYDEKANEHAEGQNDFSNQLSLNALLDCSGIPITSDANKTAQNVLPKLDLSPLTNILTRSPENHSTPTGKGGGSDSPAPSQSPPGLDNILISTNPGAGGAGGAGGTEGSWSEGTRGGGGGGGKAHQSSLDDLLKRISDGIPSKEDLRHIAERLGLIKPETRPESNSHGDPGCGPPPVPYHGPYENPPIPDLIPFPQPFTEPLPIDNRKA